MLELMVKEDAVKGAGMHSSPIEGPSQLACFLFFFPEEQEPGDASDSGSLPPLTRVVTSG